MTGCVVEAEEPPVEIDAEADLTEPAATATNPIGAPTFQGITVAVDPDGGPLEIDPNYGKSPGG